MEVIQKFNIYINASFPWGKFSIPMAEDAVVLNAMVEDGASAVLFAMCNNENDIKDKIFTLLPTGEVDAVPSDACDDIVSYIATLKIYNMVFHLFECSE